MGCYGLNNSTVSKFVKRNWIKENDLSNEQYSAYKHIRFKTSMLRSNLCGYNNLHIVAKETITFAGTNVNNFF